MAFAASPPEALRAWARAELRTLLPQWTIEDGDEPLALRAKRGEHDLGVWLGRPFEYCETKAPDCERVAREFLVGVARAAHEIANPTGLDPDQLIPAVRSRRVVEAYQARSEGMIAEPIAGDLFVVYMIDTPGTAAPANKRTLAELHLTPENAKARALQNLRAQLPAPAALVRPQQGNAVGVIDLGNYYTSSLLVPHSAWAEVAHAFGGQLLVAVPAPELLLYVGETDPSTVDAIAAAAREAFVRSPRGTSPIVLRWSPAGWTVATPP